MRNKKRMYCPYPIKNNQRKQNNKSRYFLQVLLIFAIIIMTTFIIKILINKPPQLMWGEYFLYLEFIYIPFLITVVGVISLLSSVFDSDINVQNNTGRWIHKFITYLFLGAIPFLIFNGERKKEEFNSLTYLIEKTIHLDIDEYYRLTDTFDKKPTFVNLYNTSIPLASINNNFQGFYLMSLNKSYGEHMDELKYLINRHLELVDLIFFSYENKNMDMDTRIEDEKIIEEISNLNFNFYLLLKFLPHFLSNPYQYKGVVKNHTERLSVLESKYNLDNK